MTTEFHDRFLDELVQLHAYLSDLRGSDQQGPSSADPEVRRLLEAMAFFSARTQQAAYRGMFDAVSWLAAEHCDFLRRPLAACGLVEVADGGGWSSAIDLPQGTPLLLESAQGGAAQLSTAVSAVIAPLRVVEARMSTTAEAKWLALRVHAPVGLAQLGWLSLYVDLLGDLGRSLGLHRALRSSCRSARYVGGPGPSTTLAPPDPNQLRNQPKLAVRFGARAGAPDDRIVSPLELVRQHFQLPQRDLFVNIELPKELRDTQAWLVLELDPSGPDLPWSPNVFVPNVIPVENVVRAPADPIVDDGLRSHHPVHPPAELVSPHFRGSSPRFELLRVERVCELEEEREITLFPSALSEAERSYRLEWHVVGGRERPHVALGVPGRLDAPRRIRLDGEWTQPGFDPRNLGRTRIRPWRLALPSVAWKLREESAAFLPSPLTGAPDQLLELLALTNREKLAVEDLKRLLGLLSAGSEVPWQSLVQGMEAVSWRERPAEPAQGGTYLEATLRCRAPSDEAKPLLDDLIDQVGVVLNAWCQDPVFVREVPVVTRAPLRLVGVGT